MRVRGVGGWVGVDFVATTRIIISTVKFIQVQKNFYFVVLLHHPFWLQLNCFGTFGTSLFNF